MAGHDRPSDEGVDDLLLLLGFVFKQRKRILPWITELDRVDRDGWDRGDDDRWAFFAIAFWPPFFGAVGVSLMVSIWNVGT